MDLNFVFIYLFFSSGVLIKASCHPYPCYARDCLDILETGFTTSGVYYVIPEGRYTGFDVYCDLSADDGGWLVFQRRLDGSVDFNRTWDEYVIGFGDPSGEHWLGNKNLKSILSQRNWNYELQIKITWRDNSNTLHYRIFDIGKYSDNYRITIGIANNEEASAMLSHDGAEFSARDKENNPSNCSAKHTGGWWFNDCRTVNLNGRFGDNETNGITIQYGGVDWALNTTEMRIRRL